MTNGRDTSVLESLSNHDGNGSENVTWKVSSRYFKLYYSRFSSWGILLELILKDCIEGQKMKNSSRPP